MGCAPSKPAQEDAELHIKSEKIDEWLQKTSSLNTMVQVLLGDKKSQKEYVYRCLKTWRYLYDDALIATGLRLAGFVEKLIFSH